MLAQTTQNTLYGIPPEYLLFLIGIAILIWSVGRMRKHKKQSAPQPTVPTPTGLTARELRQTATELGSMLAELQDASRRIAAQIDNRTTKLDVMLQEADAKIRQLETLMEQAQGLEKESRAGGQRSAEENREGAGGSFQGGGGSMEVEPKYHRIYDLADRGHTPREIAQELNMPPGEIELILNLRPRTARG